MKHDRNISMTGNKIFPKEILLGSDNGMQVVNTETLDFDEIFSNKWSQRNEKHQRKSSSKFPTPCFKDTSNKKSKWRRPRITKIIEKNSREVECSSVYSVSDKENAQVNLKHNNFSNRTAKRKLKYKNSVNVMLKTMNNLKFTPRMPLQETKVCDKNVNLKSRKLSKRIKPPIDSLKSRKTYIFSDFRW